MAFLEIAGRRLEVPPGESVVGTDPSAAVRLEGAGIGARHAILHTTADGQVSVRRADENLEILINGVHLGPQPTPLLHGDKIEIAGQELFYVDERRSGSTMYVQAVDPAAYAAKKSTGLRSATTGTGGRLVSLTDGREYTIVGASLVIGREAGCDAVVTSKAVSRRHAEVLVTPKGYMVIDSSTNGTLVNGRKIEGQKLLARADVIRVGDHEFRFYADLAPEERAAPAPPPEGAVQRLADTLHGVPSVGRPKAAPPGPVAAPPGPVASPPGPAAAPAPGPAMPAPPPAVPSRPAPRTAEGIGVPPAASPPPRAAPRPSRTADAPRPSGSAGPLAFLIVRSGMLKGQRIAIRVPVVNVGRADYNDIVLPDDSVSTVHAKFQRREGIWVLVDLDSTNGTFVDGERVEQDVPLAPGALVRFGEVRGFFEPADQDEPEKGGSTKLISAIKIPPDK